MTDEIEQIKANTKTMTDHFALMGKQDDCLLRLVEGKKPRPEYLDALPPWRAVVIAKLAFKIRLMSQEEVQALIDRAYDSKDGK